MGAVVIASGIIWYALKGSAQTAQREVLPKPNITTLDPAKFTGKTRSAYEAASEVPEVLAQLPCYCGCMTGFGHKNNLDCFHDEHGVECTMCQDIAMDAEACTRMESRWCVSGRSSRTSTAVTLLFRTDNPSC